MKKDRNIKFVRIRGRIVPIRSKRKDGGKDLRRKDSVSSQKKFEKNLKNIVQKHGKKPKAKDRIRSAISGAFGGAFFGSIAGLAVRGIKGSKKGAIAGSLIGAIFAGSSNSKVISRRKINKKLGEK